MYVNHTKFMDRWLQAVHIRAYQSMEYLRYLLYGHLHVLRLKCSAVKLLTMHTPLQIWDSEINIYTATKT